MHQGPIAASQPRGRQLVEHVEQGVLIIKPRQIGAGHGNRGLGNGLMITRRVGVFRTRRFIIGADQGGHVGLGAKVWPVAQDP